MNGMIFVLCLIWGFNWVVMKLGNGAFPPVLFASLRFIIGAGVLLGIAYWRKIPFPQQTGFEVVYPMWVLANHLFQHRDTNLTEFY